MCWVTLISNYIKTFCFPIFTMKIGVPATENYLFYMVIFDDNSVGASNTD